MPSIPREPPIRSGCAFYVLAGTYLTIVTGLLVWSCIGCTSEAPAPSPPTVTEPTTEPPPAESPTLKLPSVVKLTTEQQLLWQLHNEQRGASPLVPDAKLMEAAKWHATWMAENNIMSHNGEHGSTFWQRVLHTGYAPASGGENIAAGYNTPTSVFKGWMSSPGHRRNILSTSFTQIGMGDAVHPRSGKRFWCVVFARPMRGGKAATVHTEDLPVCLEGDESL